MKKILLILTAAFFSFTAPEESTTCRKAQITSEPTASLSTVELISQIQEGDIVFQSTSGGQGKAIQIATHSKYSHVGIVYKQANKWYVLEAVQPVKTTALEAWIKRGDNQHWVVKRLKDAKTYLTPEALRKMKIQGEKYLGKNYDLYFGWSDDKLYCSELVWKLYKESAGLELGALQQLKEFDLSHPMVQYKLKERYGENIPYEEKVISPATIFNCDKLMEVGREGVLE